MRRPKIPFFSSGLKSEKQSLLQALATPGAHERALQALFDGRLGFDGAAPEFDRPLVLVAFTNRSGSNLVCDYLLQTGRMAGAGEFLNQDVVAERAAQYGLETLPDYIRNLDSEIANSAKVLTIKASYDQLAMLLRARIPAMFREVIVLHCQRNNTLAQAVSYSIALRTGQWMSRQEAKSTELSEIPLDEIERQVDNFHRANLLIRLLCEAHGLRRWDIGYERLVQDKAAHLVAALRAAALVAPGWVARAPLLERQASQVNHDLAAAFLEQVRAATKPL
jgi:trehalose 2-sulfotransferase